MAAGALSWASGLQPGRDDPYPGSSQGARADRRGVGIACAALDALIRTSPAVRQCLEALLDRWQEHLSQRFGGTRAPRPQLPLLPLGVDQAALLEQRADQSSRNFLRRHLRLAEKDVLVLWLGRLSFFEKAYPQGMFIALQKAAQRCGRRLHFVMAGWFPGGESDHSRYQEVARFHAPDVPGPLPRWQEPGGGPLLLGGGRSFPVTGRQPSGNIRPGASGSYGGWLACCGERLGRLPLHRERWCGGVFSADTQLLLMHAKERSWPCNMTMAYFLIRTMSAQ